MRVQILIDDVPFFDSGERDMSASTRTVLAHLWCSMSDDDQAQFFEEVGRIMDSWPNARGEIQKEYIASHMNTCECSTARGHQVLQDIADRLRPRP